MRPADGSELPRSRFLVNFALADHRSTIIGRISERLLSLDDKQLIQSPVFIN